MIRIFNLKAHKFHKFIIVDNYESQVWNCPDYEISKNIYSVGVWKIKQLKK